MFTPKEIFHMNLTIMKDCLNLAEYTMSRESVAFRSFRKQTMMFFYNEMRQFFSKMVVAGKIEQCECGADVKDGYTSCEKCGGCGYKPVGA